MLDFAHLVYEIIVWIFLIYSGATFIIYSWVGISAYIAVSGYKHNNSFTDYSIIATNPNAPTFSLIAPAYNEGMTIVENVRSLLSLYYHNLEIIIVNDGSRDDSIAKLIEAYNLESTSFFIQGNIETKNIKAVYKSKNPAFKKLIVVDKENGGKADALNVGINISSGEYIVCIDVDCILEQDAILKLAKPFLEQTDKRVIACGGVIRLANNCQVIDGKVVDINLPKSLLGRTQALEYIRAFVLGRMAWSRASGLILISGAFGAFDKQIVLACGGYDSKTVGEDMELVVRMRRYMEDNQEPYDVVNIPDPLCWTEVPETKEILSKQRNRWMRGTMETLWKHRKLIFNPKYHRFGMISMPYWLFFEFLGPLIEFTGYIIFLIFLILGIVNWSFFFSLFALVIASGILYSIYAILIDLVSHQVYSKRQDLSKLITTAILEPFYFHPMVVKAGVKGVWDYFQNKHGWGEMTRQGFQTKSADEPLLKRIGQQVTILLNSFATFAITFLCLYTISVGLELFWYESRFEQLPYLKVAEQLFFDNLNFAFKLLAVTGILFLILGFIRSSLAKLMLILSFSFVIIVQFVLFLYFSESRNLLGADVFYYNASEMKQILEASGMLSLKNIAFFIILLVASVIPFWLVSKKPLKTPYTGSILLLLGVASCFFSIQNFSSFVKGNNEFVYNASTSKWRYFLNSNVSDYLERHPEFLAGWRKEGNEALTAESNFPFLRKEDTEDILGPYLNKTSIAPNLVVIIVEGLGHAYSSPEGYVGNFTPFIDSLSRKSLFWENNFSSAGRTFAVLPTLTGSLPFGPHGFLEQEALPNHFNLYNILQKNGFNTGFFYGGNSEFDFMNKFLQFSKVDTIVDQAAFAAPYKKLPANNGSSWGYEDQAVFSKMLETQKIQDHPYFHILLTLSTHNPFLINNASYYQDIFDKRIKDKTLSESNKKWAVENQKQLVSVLNLDDALSQFFKEYQKRSDFANTLFVITGDHAMPEIPIQTKIDRYHVPLIIYSPLLKTNRSFRNAVSHFDIAPSLLAYYRENFGLQTPKQVTWIGRGLKKGVTTETGIAMMQGKNQLIDFVYNSYHLSNGKLYKLDEHLNEDPIDDSAIYKTINTRFESFKQKNRKFYIQKKLAPDSVYTNYFNQVIPER
ncbi:glycosyl transferase family 2 [Pseudopedobacter saltans DSM 12145]|uniref:Glycosyl transferase family 2 n=1 Tax=Pseudopedobacter saltans (strain ATCC 51119 / DSM 12145 / JCM 21818 / CCUG 39354 / LMG 10337 / NBRC 100064 / NCIMB 13643) TaxID=762903 RepID=F0S7E9_PSESL|nr:sulfatase-like hydrolase/transferase [Pseudopedobacter saltans]ADY51174.1 glycosyl transferase family 2 [Pseudopedobacter saltans DSM 12145]